MVVRELIRVAVADAHDVTSVEVVLAMLQTLVTAVTLEAHTSDVLSTAPTCEPPRPPPELPFRVYDNAAEFRLAAPTPGVKSTVGSPE